MSLYNALMNGTMTCVECFAAVYLEDEEMHAKWHAHLDRLIDAGSGKRGAGK